MLHKTTGQSSRIPQIGIGSFAFRYAIGRGEFQPPNPMTAMDFLSEAHELGFGGVQLCENLGYSSLSDDELLAIKSKADRLGLFIEIGMRYLTPENLSRHLEIAKLMSSGFLRMVLGPQQTSPAADPEALRAKSARILLDALPQLRKQGVTVGIENNFDLTSDQLVRLVEDIDDKHVGLILDTTNCLGFTERPQETLEIFQPHVLSVHLKDYAVYRVEAGFIMTGTTLGEGWLDIDTLLKSILESSKVQSIIMEMCMRRNEQHTVEETLVWEREAIEKSANFLQKMFD